jgi:pyruvate/2-oxoglutarate dehydrogenase complex dihydrolipoamide acyltransferase (E2) component
MNRNDQFNTTWRKVASTIYKKPVDSKVFGGVEFDVTELEKYISQKRKEGLKITLTHFFVLVLARALKTEIPEFNTYIRRGKIISRPSIDAGVSVLQSDGAMSSIIVPNADSLNFSSLESFMNAEILKSRKGNENRTMQSKNILVRLPWPFRNWFFNIYKMLTINWGIYTPVLGVSANSFGSFMVTNIGSLGLDYGFPALLPTSNISFVLVMGGIKKKPVVIDDEIVIRRMMSVGIVFDHRIADASQGASLMRCIKHAVKHPEEFER